MEEQKEAKKENSWKEIVKFTLIALAIIIPVRVYIAQPFIVNGASMEPTFHSGDYLIVDQISYHFSNPKREDVIILRYPNNPKVFYVKRIVGLPGETVIMSGGKIRIKNKENPQGIDIDDSHVSPERQSKDSFSISLGSTEYFVMGDNRTQSSDSRAWGPLEADKIIGKPLIRLYPISKIDLFPGQ